MELRRTRSRALTGRCVRELVTAACSRSPMERRPFHQSTTIVHSQGFVGQFWHSLYVCTKGRPWQLRRRVRACKDIKQSEYVLISWDMLQFITRSADNNLRGEVLLPIKRRSLEAP